jgi:predicted transposase/invertase (TIGR01784 family)
MDDVFFSAVIKEKRFCQELLQVVLNDPLLTVKEIKPQKDIINLVGRSVRVDALCTLGNGKNVNIEVQKANNDDHVRRVRYNASILTNSLTPKGSLFKNIPDLIMIYISAFDIFRQNQVYYEVIRQLKYLDGTIHDSNEVQNGIMEIYINTVVDDNSKIARLMKIFADNEAYSEEFPNISDIKKQYQGIEKGEIDMYEYFKTHFQKAFDSQFNLGLQQGLLKGREQGLEQGLLKGRQENTIEIAKKMQKRNMQPEEISQITGLSLEQLRQI